AADHGVAAAAAQILLDHGPGAGVPAKRAGEGAGPDAAAHEAAQPDAVVEGGQGGAPRAPAPPLGPEPLSRRGRAAGGLRDAADPRLVARSAPRPARAAARLAPCCAPCARSKAGS